MKKYEGLMCIFFCLLCILGDYFGFISVICLFIFLLLLKDWIVQCNEVWDQWLYGRCAMSPSGALTEIYSILYKIIPFQKSQNFKHLKYLKKKVDFSYYDTQVHQNSQILEATSCAYNICLRANMFSNIRERQRAK